jgi:hypothetical protein
MELKTTLIEATKFFSPTKEGGPSIDNFKLKQFVATCILDKLDNFVGRCYSNDDISR